MSDKPEQDKKLEAIRINLDNLPEIPASSGAIPESQLNGYNNVKAFLEGFSMYMNISKAIDSENTKRTYYTNAKQFVIWCNLLEFAINNIKRTLDLRNLIICYEKALSSTGLSQNSIALKHNSVKKFFAYYNFINEGKFELNLKTAFSSDFITGYDPNAFKKQVRINDEVFEAIKEQVMLGDLNDRWIFFFLAFGLRRSEICQIKVANLDWLNKEINCYQQKQGTMKKLPMPDWITELDVKKSDIYLIHNKSKRCAKTKGILPVTAQYIYTKITRWRDATEFKEVSVTPHSFRRYFVSSLLKKGASDSNISRLGGWSSTKQVAKYGYDIELGSNPIVVNNQVKQ